MNAKHPIALVALLILGTPFMACSTFGDAPGSAADGGVVGPPADCDVNAEPKDAPACVVNDYGVFVDSTAGADSNAGTREAPLKTIGAALAKANGKPRVYLCDGTYAESVSIVTAVSVYGGFNCSTWMPSGQPAVLAPAPNSIGLTITGVLGAISMSDINLDARSASLPGWSSIAAFVSGSSDPVNFIRTRFTAGDGADGVSASAFAPLSPGEAPAGQPGTPSDAARVATVNTK